MPMFKQQIRLCTSRDGVRLAYAVTGSGAPLVKAANWMSHLEFDVGSPVWSHMITALSAHHTLIRYDERGCGLSDRDVEDLSFDAWLRDLETIVDANGVEHFPLLGISQGASIAVAYAVAHPGRVSHLILHGGYARGRLKRDNLSPRLREEAELMNKLAELGWGQENPAFRQFFTTQFIPGGTAEQHAWFNELERVSTSPLNAARFMRVFNDIDVVALLPKVTCPTLVLHAVRDARVPFDEGRLIASEIPGARFVPLESGNHLLLDTEPAWRRWLDEVRAFLPAAAPVRDPAFTALTRRERDIVELIAQGRDNAQIAARLDLCEKTVRNHITSIFAKLEVENRAQAIVLARKAGFDRADA
ncbi:alpha/beta fold hydrolase [Cupriavidus oxalaticus]|uniref:Alpha/beta fold hydrolase n=1 Tax=Cupriavidus oxalaticus TaxID=96344 RepID=A0A375FZX7_9BURK|nr:alpha/beta fold hydrolase [Cupriavidus oxalaticus]QRQ86175.1 alpha/beta fold hydrolase [Cupriavidus oxalaticus]QRQ95498.1 alpha/beta fold hydrolase [Cupriavidus oxalaticus]WQD84162.1 alpha/beta fold hydrolase [Cupriavidus oxalaticus]SPC12027.1 LuxR family transcriptional regulator [Cupriavidus oxalaticus]